MKKYRIAIIGAGFAGAIIAHQLIKHTNVELFLFDKHEKMSDSESGTGLNINPNGIRALSGMDPKLTEALLNAGLPRRGLTAEINNGSVIYKISLTGPLGIAKNEGLRIRWADAYTALRKDLPIQYKKTIIDFSESETSIDLEIQDDTNRETLRNIDFCIAADGRYSFVRKNLSDFPPSYIGVSNFRLVVPNDFGDTFDDMELVYFSDSSVDDGFISKYPEMIPCTQGIRRIGIMKIPNMDTKKEMLWLFGNFPIYDGIPEIAKTIEGLMHIYSENATTTSLKTKYILQMLKSYTNSIHWARMQYGPISFGNNVNKMLLVGDAAHCFVPTIGQGATIAIEDACVASGVIINDIHNGKLGLDTINKVSNLRLDRCNLAGDVSLLDSQHLIYQEHQDNESILKSHINKMQDHQNSEFLNKLKTLWNGGPHDIFN